MSATDSCFYGSMVASAFNYYEKALRQKFCQYFYCLSPTDSSDSFEIQKKNICVYKPLEHKIKIKKKS